MSTIKANTLLHSDGSTTTQPSIPALDQRMAKAWVNFNGTSTVAIRDSYNVSSITDDAVGNYRVNFTTAMANNNYAEVASCGGVGGSSGDHSFVPFSTASGGTTSQGHQMRASHHDGTRTDVQYMSYTVFSN